MRIAIYIEGPRTQIVLTPETDWEKTALDGLNSGQITVKRGSFYTCQGGWIRHSPTNDDDSIMLLVDKP